MVMIQINEKIQMKKVFMFQGILFACTSRIPELHQPKMEGEI